MRVISFFFLGAVLLLLTYGGLVVIDSATSDVISTLTYFWETQENDTLITTSGTCQNFTLQRISEMQDAQLKITFTGGNESDLVYVNGNLVGNLSGSSPKTITFSPLYLDVNTCVSYDFVNDADTNVTHANLTYYRYDGCNFDEETCNNLQVTTDITVVFLSVLSNLPLLLGIFGVLVVLRWFT